MPNVPNEEFDVDLTIPPHYDYQERVVERMGYALLVVAVLFFLYILSTL